MEAIFIIAVLQLLDVLTTVKALKNSNNIEANPLLAYLFKRFGVLPVLLVVKVVFLGLLVLTHQHIAPLALWLIAGGYCAVVLNNYKLLKKQ